MTRKRKKRTGGKRNPVMKFIRRVAILLFIIAVLTSGGLVYSVIYRPNVKVTTNQSSYLYISTGSRLEDVVDQLVRNHFIINSASFRFIAEQMNYRNNVHPGRYHLDNDMSNIDLVRLLRSGKQVPITITFNRLRTVEQLAAVFSNKLEADSSELGEILSDKFFLKSKGLDRENVVSVFIPNTYEFYWNTSAREVFEKMEEEHEKFWNEDRRQKAKTIGLSVTEVSVLASIIEMETNRNDEKDIIAGVYLNRLRKNWLLQADPTLIFALREFNIQRVLDEHKLIDSPYNTYLHTGLPPGPIVIPSISSIDAVLNAADHKYVYFCAKADTSGYHVFAITYSQHLANANMYHKFLNKLKIK
ncbi:MAG: endolytic transglycosylase MltG [Bacteroidetes bacterium]|nr:endolytic transglycosylase MltG [Bacteroidota bacterium]